MTHESHVTVQTANAKPTELEVIVVDPVICGATLVQFQTHSQLNQSVHKLLGGISGEFGAVTRETVRLVPLKAPREWCERT